MPEDEQWIDEAAQQQITPPGAELSPDTEYRPGWMERIQDVLGQQGAQRKNDMLALDRYKDPNRFIARDAGIRDVGRERTYGPYQPMRPVSAQELLAKTSANFRDKTAMLDYNKHMRFSDAMERAPESTNIEYGEPAPWLSWLEDKLRAAGYR
jgi:hypothetical protein